MTKPLTVLKTVEGVDNAPYGTVVETVMGRAGALNNQDSIELAKKELPARVLRWGEDHYPAKFEQVIKTLADMTAEERQECLWMQCETAQLRKSGLKAIITHVYEASAELMTSDGVTLGVTFGHVIPRFDLPRFVWPREESQETPVVSEWVGRELRENYDTFRPATLLDEYQGAARIFDTWRDAMAYADEQARTVEVVLPRFNGKTRLPAHNGHPFGYTIDATQENYASAVHIFGAWGTMGICDMEDVEPIALTLLSARYKEKQ